MRPAATEKTCASERLRRGRILPWLLLWTGCAAPDAKEEAMDPGRSAARENPVRELDTAPGWRSLGPSVQGRELRIMDLSRGEFGIYWIGSIHGNETEGHSLLPELLPEWTRSARESGIALRICEDMNPDGSAARRRGNASGVDLNRNWPAKNYRPGGGRGSEAWSEPETQAVGRDMAAFEPDLVIVFHSTWRGPFVNFDGPAQAFAKAWVDAAKTTDPRWKVVPSMGYPTPGSMGSYFGVDRNIPILTVELRRDENSDKAFKALVAGFAALVHEIQKQLLATSGS